MKPNPTRRRNGPPGSWIESLVILALVSASMPAWAQEAARPTVELSDSQLDLNAHAIELIGAGRLEDAIPLFESSLSLGKSNVTYLNLGRTLARLGRCTAAAEAFDAVEEAPVVPEPTPDQVLQTLGRYRDDLDSCGIKLRLRCEPADLKVAVDGGDPVACPAEPLQLDAGTHEVVATRSDGEQHAETVSAAQGETIQLVLQMPLAETIEVIREPDAPPPLNPKLPRTARIVGWSLVGTGLTILTVATILDAFVTTPKVNEFKADPGAHEDQRTSLHTLMRTGKVLFPAGLVIAGGGTAMLLFWPRSSPDREALLTLNWRFAF